MFHNPFADALVVILILLLILGPKRLPTLGRSLGQGIKEFKDSVTGHSSSDEDERRPELSPSSASAGEATAPSSAPAGSSADRAN